MSNRLGGFQGTAYTGTNANQQVGGVGAAGIVIVTEYIH